MAKASTKVERVVCSDCFKSLGIDARIKMYLYLREHGETTVSGLVKLVKLTQPTVSYHLKEMRELGLLSSRKSGKEVHYSVNEGHHSCGHDCILHLVKFPDEHASSN